MQVAMRGEDAAGSVPIRQAGAAISASEARPGTTLRSVSELLLCASFQGEERSRGPGQRGDGSIRRLHVRVGRRASRRPPTRRRVRGGAGAHEAPAR